MRLVTLLAAAGLVYAAYALISTETRRTAPSGPRRLPPPGPEHRGAARGGTNHVRDAGPGPDTRLGRLRDWDEVDEASDESFPASDPPARW